MKSMMHILDLNSISNGIPVSCLCLCHVMTYNCIKSVSNVNFNIWLRYCYARQFKCGAYCLYPTDFTKWLVNFMVASLMTSKWRQKEASTPRWSVWIGLYRLSTLEGAHMPKFHAFLPFEWSIQLKLSLKITVLNFARSLLTYVFKTRF